jgi:arginyl-tRNA synthetase
MDLYADVGRRIGDALASLAAQGTLPPEGSDSVVETETPRDASHGDVSSNIAMVLAKRARMKPRDIADKIAEHLRATDAFAKVEVAGPGFLNVTLKPEAWHGLVAAILKDGSSYGRSDLGAGTKLNLEYVSANPTGPMHVGHCRGAVFGDALANLLAFTGHQVTREYYINDAGGQVDVLARSAFLRYREALGENIGDIPEGLYPGDYLKPVGEALAAEHGRKLLDQAEEDWLPTVRAKAIAMMMAAIKEDLAALNINHDVFFSEASLKANGRDDVGAAIAALRKDGLIYEGRLERPKGHDDEDWEDREQTLFSSTRFGDDVDRALMKSDGSYTYFASDIAYHYNKLQRGFDQLIDVFGADHVGYIPRMKAAVAALGHGNVAFDIKVCQLVKLFRNGEPVRMSKRAGTFVTLRDVVDEVGRDAVRFMMLYRKNDAPLDFDLAKVIEKAKENPVFYVQYGHARAASVMRQAAEQLPSLVATPTALAASDLSSLTDSGEVDIMRRLAEFPRLIAGAARAHEPHRLAFYLYELAAALHQQYTRGYDSPHLRFIQPLDSALTSARLALVLATKQVISSGLGMLGVGAPEEMR